MSKIRYKSSKTNGFETYDSYADFNLVTALVRSFKDVDMQQWQGFKDAINELTGVSDWIIDITNNRITYLSAPTPNMISHLWYTNHNGFQGYSVDASDLCEAIPWGLHPYSHTEVDMSKSPPEAWCWNLLYGGDLVKNLPLSWSPNPDYDPNAVRESLQLDFYTVAQKIISNTTHTNQSISLLAETYLETITQSIFNQDESKQFVKLSDLISQFELNKTLRT